MESEFSFVYVHQEKEKILVYKKFTAELCVSSCINPATSCVAGVSPVKKCTDNLHALLISLLLLLLFPKHTNIYTRIETHVKKRRYTHIKIFNCKVSQKWRQQASKPPCFSTPCFYACGNSKCL